MLFRSLARRCRWSIARLDRLASAGDGTRPQRRRLRARLGRRLPDPARHQAGDAVCCRRRRNHRGTAGACRACSTAADSTLVRRCDSRQRHRPELRDPRHVRPARACRPSQRSAQSVPLRHRLRSAMGVRNRTCTMAVARRPRSSGGLHRRACHRCRPAIGGPALVRLRTADAICAGASGVSGSSDRDADHRLCRRPRGLVLASERRQTAGS